MAGGLAYPILDGLGSNLEFPGELGWRSAGANQLKIKLPPAKPVVYWVNPSKGSQNREPLRGAVRRTAPKLISLANITSIIGPLQFHAPIQNHLRPTQRSNLLESPGKAGGLPHLIICWRNSAGYGGCVLGMWTP